MNHSRYMTRAKDPSTTCADMTADAPALLTCHVMSRHMSYHTCRYITHPFPSTAHHCTALPALHGGPRSAFLLSCLFVVRSLDTDNKSLLSMVPYSNPTPVTSLTTAVGTGRHGNVNVIITSTGPVATPADTHPHRLMTSDTISLRPLSFSSSAAATARRSPTTTNSISPSSPPHTQWRTLLVLLSVLVFTIFVLVGYTADMPVFRTFQLYSSSSTSSSSSRQSSPTILPTTSSDHHQYAFHPHCVHLLAPNAPPNDWKPFNSRSFCVYPRMCFTPRHAVQHTPTLFLPFFHHGTDKRESGHVKPVSKCLLTTANFSLDANESLTERLRQNDVDVCRHVERNVWCAHGTYNQSHYYGICPNIAYSLPSASAFTADRRRRRRSSSSGITEQNEGDIDGDSPVTIVLPPLKHLSNIFHFAQAVVPIFHMAVNLPSLLPQLHLQHQDNNEHEKKDVVLLFRGEHPRMFCNWANSVLDAFIQHRLLLSDARSPTWIRSVSIRSTEENFWFHTQFNRTFDLARYLSSDNSQTSESPPYYCTTGTTVLMGERLNINNWIFPNHDNDNVYTWPFTGVNGTVSYGVNSSVPLEALVFRRVLYKQASLKTLLPESLLLSGRVGYTPPKKLLLDLPPLTLSYARRNNGSDPLPGETHPLHGPVRRFSDADEEWFETMLRRIANKHTFTYTRIQPTAQVALAKQTEMFLNSGMIVGLHGANLLNAASAPAFSVLAEIANHETRCYVNGGNAGLAFMSYRPVRTPGQDESKCPRKGELGFLCRLHKAWRPVVIDQGRDRQMIESMVEHGVRHVKRLHKRFGGLGGVPVVYDAERAVYWIDWKQARR